MFVVFHCLLRRKQPRPHLTSECYTAPFRNDCVPRTVVSRTHNTRAHRIPYCPSVRKSIQSTVENRHSILKLRLRVGEVPIFLRRISNRTRRTRYGTLDDLPTAACPRSDLSFQNPRCLALRCPPARKSHSNHRRRYHRPCCRRCHSPPRSPRHSSYPGYCRNPHLGCPGCSSAADDPAALAAIEVSDLRN